MARQRSEAAAGAAPSPSGIYWRLSKAVTACAASNRILFLDMASDRYLALPPALNEPFIEYLNGSACELPLECCAILGELGVVTAAPIRCSVARPKPVDAEWLPPSPASIRDFLGVGRAVLAASQDVRSRPLGAVLDRRFSASKLSGHPPPNLCGKLATFRTVRPLLPIPRVCLHDCLALMDWLGPESGAELVLGVAAYPFSAHSWVQANGAQLDDHPVSPSRFQPILHLS